ncbi:MAG TPA: hypothetical protein VK524_15780, partial [Polyangiaceae bacterium]|nr:hypothetical protein [Polyangiaceae bacterium]
MTVPLSISGRWRGLLLLAIAAAGCREQPVRPAEIRDAARETRPGASATRARKNGSTGAAAPLAEARDASSSDAASERDSGPRAPSGSSHWTFDKAVDVGPAGPASASELGVVFVTSTDEIALAPLTKTVRAGAARPAASPLKPVADDTPLRQTTRRPLILGQSAYWVSAGRLLRRSLLAGAKLEVLRPDARTGTRVSGDFGGAAPLVAYISSTPSGDPRAKLWTESQAGLDLSPEGSSASSILLLRHAADRLLFLALEGRSAMSPVHARTILMRGARAELGPDRVLWVGGSAQSSTELSAVEDDESNVWALVALERSATEFGLAVIPTGSDNVATDAAAWTLYPNGIDPAPVASGRLCDQTAVLSVRPATSAPSSHQRLHLSRMAAGTLADEAIVLEARRIREVSLATWSG